MRRILTALNLQLAGLRVHGKELQKHWAGRSDRQPLTRVHGPVWLDPQKGVVGRRRVEEALLLVPKQQLNFKNIKMEIFGSQNILTERRCPASRVC